MNEEKFEVLKSRIQILNCSESVEIVPMISVSLKPCSIKQVLKQSCFSDNIIQKCCVGQLLILEFRDLFLKYRLSGSLLYTQ